MFIASDSQDNAKWFAIPFLLALSLTLIAIGINNRNWFSLGVGGICIAILLIIIFINP